ncbi:MAG: CotH kinase family protein, partial [Clostridia bacterium]|nr:CotH kinase family protein [Clostridia bacterium]
MSTHKHFDKICYAVLALVLVITILLLLFADSFTVVSSGVNMEYANKLFDDSYVHSIDIIMDDWDGFTQSCENEEYTACNLVIDGETYNNVAIRAKGNTSLTQVSSYGNNRYSFKIEFDKYDSSVSYYGLDKLCLNNIIQDNTYMKDYLVYSLMGDFGVASPLCSYVNISVNGETFGLYLAVEGVEESFLERNYGTDYGELYKPDSMSMGGGKGNGKAFEADDDAQELPDSNSEVESDNDNFPQNNEQQNNFQPIRGEMPDGQTDFKKGNMPAGSNGMKDGEPPEMPQNSEGENAENPIMPDAAPDINNAENNDSERKTGFGNMSAKGSDDVSLIYSDDDYDSYSNIFDNAKTNITDSDKDRLIASVKNINNNENIGSSVDVEQVIRYFVVHNYVLNFDSYTGSMIHNYYLYEKDGKLSMIPWDYNLAFGSFNSSMDAESLINYPIDEPVSGGTVESRPMLAWIFANEEYTELYHELFSEFIAEFFDNSKVEAMIAKTQEMISPYVKADPTKFC